MRYTVIAALLLATPAWGHSSPSGWAYPISCCSNLDCRPLPCDALEEIEDGKVRDIENGQTYERSMVQSSGDHHCHICTEGGLSNGKPLCVFTVNGS
jgi:hypothetical protein